MSDCFNTWTNIITIPQHSGKITCSGLQYRLIIDMIYYIYLYIYIYMQYHHCHGHSFLIANFCISHAAMYSNQWILVSICYISKKSTTIQLYPEYLLHARFSIVSIYIYIHYIYTQTFQISQNDCKSTSSFWAKTQFFRVQTQGLSLSRPLISDISLHYGFNNI